MGFFRLQQSTVALLLSGVFLWPFTARADLEWLAKSQDCQTFHNGVSRYFGTLGDLNNLSVRQKSEISLVIDEACGPRFADCKFKICNNRPSVADTESYSSERETGSSSVASKQEVPSEQGAVESPDGSDHSANDDITTTTPADTAPSQTVEAPPAVTVNPPEENLSAEREDILTDEVKLQIPVAEQSPGSIGAETSDSSASNLVPVAAGSPAETAAATSAVSVETHTAPAKSPFITDPLAWLEREMECDEFLEQIRVRYEPLGKFSELPEVKKDELRTVLSLVCSERFKHCNYPSCSAQPATGKAVKSVTTDASSQRSGPSKDEIAQMIKERSDVIQRAYLADRESMKQAIEAKIADERRNRLQWQRFSIQAEVEARKPEVRVERKSPFDAGPSTSGYSGGVVPDSGGNRASGKTPREYSEPKRSPYRSSGSGSNRLSAPEAEESELPRTKNIPIPAPGNYAPKPLGF